MNVGGSLLRRLGLWAVLAALLAGPFGPAAQLHAEANDDPACAGTAGEPSGDATLPAVSAPAARAGDGHCATCHWLHALRWAAVVAATTVADASGARPFDLESPPGTTPSRSFQLASRGPPLASTPC